MRRRTGRIAALAAAALLAGAPGAGAADIGRAGLGSQIETLFTAGAGVWIAGTRFDDEPLLGHATAGGLSVRRVDERLTSGMVGPDGPPWFVAGEQLLRAGAPGELTPVASLPVIELGFYAAVTGPDGRLWAMPQAGTRLVRTTPAGVAASARSGLPACSGPAVSPAQLRRLARQLAAGHSPTVWFTVLAIDADGNHTGATRTVRVTR